MVDVTKTDFESLLEQERALLEKKARFGRGSDEEEEEEETEEVEAEMERLRKEQGKEEKESTEEVQTKKHRSDENLTGLSANIQRQKATTRQLRKAKRQYTHRTVARPHK